MSDSEASTIDDSIWQTVQAMEGRLGELDEDIRIKLQIMEANFTLARNQSEDAWAMSLNAYSESKKCRLCHERSVNQALEKIQIVQDEWREVKKFQTKWNEDYSYLQEKLAQVRNKVESLREANSNQASLWKQELRQLRTEVLEIRESMISFRCKRMFSVMWKKSPRSTDYLFCAVLLTMVLGLYVMSCLTRYLEEMIRAYLYGVLNEETLWYILEDFIS